MALLSANDDDINRTHYEACNRHIKFAVDNTCNGPLRDGAICLTQTPADNNKCCLLLQLPIEVRRLIWSFVVVEDRVVSHLLDKHTNLGNRQTSPTEDGHQDSRSPVGLLCTCRLIYEEAIDVTLAENRFQIGVSMTRGIMSHGTVTAVSVAMCKGCRRWRYQAHCGHGTRGL
jgi:hypothetical protein